MLQYTYVVLFVAVHHIMMLCGTADRTAMVLETLRCHAHHVDSRWMVCVLPVHFPSPRVTGAQQKQNSLFIEPERTEPSMMVVTLTLVVVQHTVA
jgi:hypothetical protein